MALEIAPLKPYTTTPWDYRTTLAGRLFEAGTISIQEASEIAGIEQKHLEEMFIERRIITQNRILVCGGAGFIGSNFVHYLLEKYPYDIVCVYDKLTYAGNKDNLRSVWNNPRYSFYKGDIADKKTLETVIQKEHIDYIVNFAAETHVTRSLYGSDEFLQTNVLGTHTLLESVRKYRSIKRLVHISTDEVYGTLQLDEEYSFLEDDPFKPNVPYSAAKAGGDLLARAWRHSYNIPVIVTHCTNNYGPFQYPEKLIPNSLFRVLNNKPITIHGKGQHMRDWLFVTDHCKALDLLLRHGTDGEVYNIAAQEEYSVLDVARTVLRLLGKKNDFITFIEDRPGNDLRYSLNTEKIEKVLHWKPTISFEEGIQKTIQWYESNTKWVEAIQEKDKEIVKYI